MVRAMSGLRGGQGVQNVIEQGGDIESYSVNISMGYPASLLMICYPAPFVYSSSHIHRAVWSYIVRYTPAYG